MGVFQTKGTSNRPFVSSNEEDLQPVRKSGWFFSYNMATLCITLLYNKWYNTPITLFDGTLGELHMNLHRGQKVDITKQRGFHDIKVQISWKSLNPDMEIDASAFLLSSSGKCEQDENFIFYGNPVSLDKAVSYTANDHLSQVDFMLSWNKLNPSHQKIAIALTIHEGDHLGFHFNQVSQIRLDIIHSTTLQTYYTFELGSDMTLETAIVAGEFYLHNGDWKFNAIGSGFFGGLKDLCTNYGLQISDDYPTELEDINPLTKSEVAVASSTDIKDLSYTQLSKEETAAMQKSPTVVTELVWNSSEDDLDFYCFYVTKDNKAGKVYYNNLGNSQISPYIVLDGDSRSGGTERITFHRTEHIKYALFAAYHELSSRVGSFISMKPHMIVSNASGQKVMANLLKKNNSSSWVVFACIDFTDDNQMKVIHIEKYSGYNSEKSPILYLDGTFLMDKGPEEFKSYDDDISDPEFDHKLDYALRNRNRVLDQVSEYVKIADIIKKKNPNQFIQFKDNNLHLLEAYIDSLVTVEDMVYLTQFIPLIKEDQIEQIKLLYAELRP